MTCLKRLKLFFGRSFNKLEERLKTLIKNSGNSRNTRKGKNMKKERNIGSGMLRVKET